MGGILIYSANTKLASELLTAAFQIGKETGLGVHALSINDSDQANELAQSGVEVLSISNVKVTIADTARLACALQQAVQRLGINIILLSSDRRGKELSGRLSQKLGGGCLNDVLKLQLNQDGHIECVRNSLGGATLAIQCINTEIKVIAISPKAYERVEAKSKGKVTDLEVEIEEQSVVVIESRSKVGDTVDIEAAEVLVAVGLGVERDDLENVESIARSLGGELACSKPIATDKKWLSEDRLIGLSGKKCKPNLAILFGISGQVQFMVGIREAKTIVAINSDENANIMQMADYTMVAKIKDVLPEFTTILKTTS